MCGGSREERKLPSLFDRHKMKHGNRCVTKDIRGGGLTPSTGIPGPAKDEEKEARLAVASFSFWFTTAPAPLSSSAAAMPSAVSGFGGALLTHAHWCVRQPELTLMCFHVSSRSSRTLSTLFRLPTPIPHSTVLSFPPSPSPHTHVRLPTSTDGEGAAGRRFLSVCATDTFPTLVFTAPTSPPSFALSLRPVFSLLLSLRPRCLVVCNTRQGCRRLQSQCVLYICT